ncbi:hypothetical protein Sme01_05300 [Sphaerisporangium melleum]|uniref:Transposase IS701-like DDE domain-containing protein n=3 Tax=Sphaerisporangium melleum TaxID=321316 RepID=A0A917QQB7_9ACTN|nr:transposase [Sphaerisporangium melleum]GGK63160.1 hypothetical protein GCM10007964_02870 [Sphaerisporangium melleum]GII68054.1 hypothetical protein Sme01_05300 [Sphaerisporangium melleum]
MAFDTLWTDQIYAQLDAMITLLFDTLSRKDQRNWARVYLRGLVSTAGKKTIRNMARGGEGSAEQSLQQFISKSPWAWAPVRRALAQYLERTSQPPLAWVVQSLIIEKAGDQSVGVGRQFVPELGRMANCQRAVGVWFAYSGASFPVEWILTLPAPWTTERVRRHSARIPDTARSQTPTQEAIDAVVRMSGTWQLEQRPVIMAVSNADLHHTMEAFSLYAIPFVLKVDGSLPVALATAGRHRALPYQASARELIESLRSQRRLADWRGQGASDGAGTPLAAAAVHAAPGEDRTAVELQPLLLFGAWTEPSNPLPSGFWITNLRDMPLSQLFTLAKLLDQTALDFAEVSEAVGIRDFEGRSYRGWHHHATLASVAHAATLFALRGQRVSDPAARTEHNGRMARSHQGVQNGAVHGPGHAVRAGRIDGAGRLDGTERGDVPSPPPPLPTPPVRQARTAGTYSKAR